MRTDTSDPPCLRCHAPAAMHRDFDENWQRQQPVRCRGYINTQMTVERALKEMGDSFRQFSRNGRWGTCSGCPRDIEHHAYPEFCEFTMRYDHQLTVDGLASAYVVFRDAWKRE